MYPRSTSVAPPASHGPQHTPPSAPERVRTDSFLFTDAQTRNALAGRPDPLAAAAQSRLVSIYAAQGPPDRTPDFFAQKIDPGTPALDQLATPGSMMPPNLNKGPGIGRRPRTTSQDRAGYRQSMALPNGVPPSAAPTPAPRPQSRSVPLHQAPSITSLRHFMSVSHTQVTITNTTSQTGMRPDAQAEHGVGGFAPANTSLAPPQATEQMQKASSAGSQRPSLGRPTSTIPQATGFSSYSQSVAAQASLMPPGQASRVPSDNSGTRSPRRQSNPPLPGDHLFSAMPISRNPSDSSNSTENGAYHPVQQFHTMQTPQSTSQPPHLASSMPASAAPRALYDPPIISHQNSTHASHAHSHVQVSNHVSSSLHPQSMTAAENNLPRGNNAYSMHLSAHASSTSTSAQQARYPHNQQQHTQPSPPRNAPANVYLPTQSQSQAQSHVMPTHDRATTAPTPASHSHSRSNNSAVNAANPPASHRQSVLLSSQPVQSPVPPALYHNHSSSRHDASIHQRLQTMNNVTRPSPPAQGNAQLSRNPARSSTYITPTQQAVLQLEESSTPIGHGANIDTAANDRPQAQQTQAPTPMNRPPSIIASTPTSARPVQQARPSSRDAPHANDRDGPPPLTPSNSSRESHEEILMTPSSLYISRTQTDTIQRSNSQRSESQRLEKKRTGIFGLFRSNTKSKPSKTVPDQRPPEGRRSLSGPAESPAAENIGYNGGRLTRISTAPAEATSSPAKLEPSVAASNQNRQSRSSRPVPPPLAIPPQSHSIPYRLFTSKSKRYRTMSSASMEALDGTAVSASFSLCCCLFVSIGLLTVA